MTANDNAGTNGLAMAVLNAIQNPVVMVDANGHIAFANWEGEAAGLKPGSPLALRVFNG